MAWARLVLASSLQQMLDVFHTSTGCPREGAEVPLYELLIFIFRTISLHGAGATSTSGDRRKRGVHVDLAHKVPYLTSQPRRMGRLQAMPLFLNNVVRVCRAVVQQHTPRMAPADRDALCTRYLVCLPQCSAALWLSPA